MSGTVLRVDARRNVERVLDAAMRVLGENPGASVEEVAVASGVHRSTVYRRFPTREALVQALLERALDEIGNVVRSAAAGTPAEERFRRLCSELVAVGERYAFLLAHYHVGDLGPDPVGLVKVMRRYQRAGILRDDQPAPWLASAFSALGTALLDGPVVPVATPEIAARLLAEMFLVGAKATP